MKCKLIRLGVTMLKPQKKGFIWTHWLHLRLGPECSSWQFPAVSLLHSEEDRWEKDNLDLKKIVIKSNQLGLEICDSCICSSFLLF